MSIILGKVDSKRAPKELVFFSLVFTILCDLDTCFAQNTQNHFFDKRAGFTFDTRINRRKIDPVTHRLVFGHFLEPVVQSKGFFSEESERYLLLSQPQSQFSPWPSPDARPPYRMEGTSEKQQRELQDFLDGKSDWFAGYDSESNF
jgi:hypothetical protein